MLVHLTDNVPLNGKVRTAKDVIGWARDSVHFSVNHPVQNHLFGSWSSKKYAILAPFEATIKHPENKFVGGIAIDFFSRGSVHIPKDSVIVRFNEKIPQGKYKISDASKIDEFKMLNGVKVIETSEQNMQQVTTDIIKKMGYEHRSSWGENNLMVRFNELLRKNKMTPALHTYSPNGRTELLLENLGLRVYHGGNSWVVKSKEGNIIFDYKKAYLDTLDDIAKHKSEIPHEYNIAKLKEIIKVSDTPKVAEEKILDEFNLKCLIPPGYENWKEYNIFTRFKTLSGYDNKVLGKVNDFLKNPNLSSESELNNEILSGWIKLLPDEELAKNNLVCKNNKVANSIFHLND